MTQQSVFGGELPPTQQTHHPLPVGHFPLLIGCSVWAVVIWVAIPIVGSDQITLTWKQTKGKVLKDLFLLINRRNSCKVTTNLRRNLILKLDLFSHEGRHLKASDLLKGTKWSPRVKTHNIYNLMIKRYSVTRDDRRKMYFLNIIFQSSVLLQLAHCYPYTTALIQSTSYLFLIVTVTLPSSRRGRNLHLQQQTLFCLHP